MAQPTQILDINRSVQALRHPDAFNIFFFFFGQVFQAVPGAVPQGLPGPGASLHHCKGNQRNTNDDEAPGNVFEHLFNPPRNRDWNLFSER
jgi:hypothetical protein